ncbi:MAG: nitrous oxide reductase accessory protein NosL [Armatimonadota bacterium]|nr:nitrous oxide reductase accessory protein NosL [Armatimonadota bacterium]
MTLTRRRFLHLAALAAGGAAVAPAAWALLGRAPAAGGPPAIRYDRDRCDHCGMLISDPRFAAATRQGQTVFRYDDIGCMVAHAARALAAQAAVGYVHDMATEQWLEASAAIYVRSQAIRTPMNTGLAAFASTGAARAAFPGAPVVGWAALLAMPETHP